MFAVKCPSITSPDYETVDCEAFDEYQDSRKCWADSGIQKLNVTRDIRCYTLDAEGRGVEADNSVCLGQKVTDIYRLETLPGALLDIPTQACGADVDPDMACAFTDQVPSSSLPSTASKTPCAGCKVCQGPNPSKGQVFYALPEWTGTPTTQSTVKQDQYAGLQYSCAEAGPVTQGNLKTSDFSCRIDAYDDTNACFTSTAADLSQSGNVYSRAAGSCYSVSGTTVSKSTGCDSNTLVYQIGGWTDTGSAPSIGESDLGSAPPCTVANVFTKAATCKYEDTYAKALDSDATKDCSSCLPYCFKECGCTSAPCGSTSGDAIDFKMKQYHYDTPTPSNNPIATLNSGDPSSATDCAYLNTGSRPADKVQKGYLFKDDSDMVSLNTNYSTAGSGWQWITNQGGGDFSWEATCNAYCQQSTAACSMRHTKEGCDELTNLNCSWDSSKNTCSGQCACATVGGLWATGSLIQNPWNGF